MIDIIDPTEAAYPFDLDGDRRPTSPAIGNKIAVLRQLAATKAVLTEEDEEMAMILGPSIFI